MDAYGAQRASPALGKVCGGDNIYHSRLGLQNISRFCFYFSWHLGLVRTYCTLLGAWNLASMTIEGKEKERGKLKESRKDEKQEERVVGGRQRKEEKEEDCYSS